MDQQRLRTRGEAGQQQRCDQRTPDLQQRCCPQVQARSARYALCASAYACCSTARC